MTPPIPQHELRGLISIGTNSTRALVADLDGVAPVTVLHRSTGTRIGEGLRERGHLDEAAMQRTLKAIMEQAQAIREHTASFGIIATSALRRADNERDFAQRVRDATGVGIEIISGDEEAACSFTGAVSGIPGEPGERFGVLDVGGGSSEYAVGSKTGCEQTVSCEIGAVRLTERYPELAGSTAPVPPVVLHEAAAEARRLLAPADELPRADRLVLVGGSATTTVALVRGRREFFAYAQLTVADVDAWIARLASVQLDERRTLPGMNPQRADILLAGLVLLSAFFRLCEQANAFVSTSDVLLGYLLRHAGKR